MDNNNFNNRLRELRKERNLTQAQVAKALGLKLNTYSHMEHDGKRPSFEMIQKLADLYLISLNEITSEPKKPVGPYEIHENRPLILRNNMEKFISEKLNEPKFLKDLHTLEQDIILYYRMLPEDEQKKVYKYVERALKKNNPEEK